MLDLKPENILLSFPNGYPQAKKGIDGPTFIDYSAGPSVLVKICDFGVSSKFYRKIMLQDFCGSPGNADRLIEDLRLALTY